MQGDENGKIEGKAKTKETAIQDKVETRQRRDKDEGKTKGSGNGEGHRWRRQGRGGTKVKARRGEIA